MKRCIISLSKIRYMIYTLLSKGDISMAEAIISRRGWSSEGKPPPTPTFVLTTKTFTSNTSWVVPNHNGPISVRIFGGGGAGAAHSGGGGGGGLGGNGGNGQNGSDAYASSGGGGGGFGGNGGRGMDYNSRLLNGGGGGGSYGDGGDAGSKGRYGGGGGGGYNGNGGGGICIVQYYAES